MIKPSSLLQKRYNINPESLNKNGVMPFRVNKSDLIPINVLDDSNRKWLYIKTFDHKDTIFVRLNWELRKEIEQYKSRLWFLEGELGWYSEQLNMAKSNPAEFLSQSLDVIDRITDKNMQLINSKRQEIQ